MTSRISESVSLGGYVTQNEVLNGSTAKSMYSFGRGARFPSVKKPHTQLVGYDLPSTIKKRTCGFGIGNRFSTPAKEQKERSSKFA